MNSRLTLTACLAASVSIWCGTGTAGAAQAVANDDSNGIEVLTRGPVHEAFAGTVTFDPQPGGVVRRAPPAAIEELPPEIRPEGANVDWIPGYWAWDDDRDNFVWISGTWRNLPPGRKWLSLAPGRNVRSPTPVISPAEERRAGPERPSLERFRPDSGTGSQRCGLPTT